MLKICLIGCGRVAKSHMEGALQIKDKLEVVAVVDPVIENAEAFCRDYGVKAAFRSFEEACRAVEFEAVDICLASLLLKAFLPDSLSGLLKNGCFQTIGNHTFTNQRMPKQLCLRLSGTVKTWQSSKMARDTIFTIEVQGIHCFYEW